MTFRNSLNSLPLPVDSVFVLIDHHPYLTEVNRQQASGSGIAYLWDQQLLSTPVPSTKR